MFQILIFQIMKIIIHLMKNNNIYIYEYTLFILFYKLCRYIIYININVELIFHNNNNIIIKRKKILYFIYL